MDVTTIPWALIGGLSPAGMLMVTVGLVLTGRLVPKSTYQGMEKARDLWQAAAMKNQETIQTQAETILKQQIIGDTTTKVMSAVQDALKAGDPQ